MAAGLTTRRFADRLGAARRSAALLPAALLPAALLPAALLPAALLSAALLLGACASGRTKDSPPTEAATARGGRSLPDLARIDRALKSFAREHAGRLPSSLGDLVVEKDADGNAYLRTLLADPWGTPYAYAVLVPSAGAYDLRSFGPDTLPGTDDDVVVASATVSLD